jgi:hypothetical protein
MTTGRINQVTVLNPGAPVRDLAGKAPQEEGGTFGYEVGERPKGRTQPKAPRETPMTTLLPPPSSPGDSPPRARSGQKAAKSRDM